MYVRINALRAANLANVLENRNLFSEGVIFTSSIIGMRRNDCSNGFYRPGFYPLGFCLPEASASKQRIGRFALDPPTTQMSHCTSRCGDAIITNCTRSRTNYCYSITR